MISVQEALNQVLSLTNPPQGEQVPLDQAAGRVLLEPAVSRMTQPPFDASSMDGYAYRHADQSQTLRIIGEAAAGHPWQGEAAPGTAIRIFTGAPVPKGYDRVEMQESTRRDGEYLNISKPSGNNFIRNRGRDFAEGDEIKPGRILSPIDIALLAAMNIPRVTVAKRPKVAVLAGGDELVPPGDIPDEGQIISSNDLAVAALARLAGAETEILPIARDTEQSLRDSFRQAQTADLIVTIGGASIGDHDLVGKVALEMGMDRAFYKVAMRPGKPLMAGKLGGNALIGLPGNPVSAIVCSVIFVQPLIRRMQGLDQATAMLSARLTTALGPEGNRQHYMRAILRNDPDGLPSVEVFTDQDSSLLSVMSKANALVMRPPHDSARQPGDMVSVLPLFNQY